MNYCWYWLHWVGRCRSIDQQDGYHDMCNDNAAGQLQRGWWVRGRNVQHGSSSLSCRITVCLSTCHRRTSTIGCGRTACAQRHTPCSQVPRFLMCPITISPCSGGIGARRGNAGQKHWGLHAQPTFPMTLPCAQLLFSCFVIPLCTVGGMALCAF